MTIPESERGPLFTTTYDGMEIITDDRLAKGWRRETPLQHARRHRAMVRQHLLVTRTAMLPGWLKKKP